MNEERVYTILKIAALLAAMFAIHKTITEGRKWFDNALGSNPLGSVGTPEDLGWYSGWLSHSHGNPDAPAWDPLGLCGPSSWDVGIAGITGTWNLANPFGWW